MQSSSNVIISQERRDVKLFCWWKHSINYQQDFKLAIKNRLISTHLDKICDVIKCARIHLD